MTKIKLCGLSRLCDIETANELLPEYIGFVFAPKSRRYVSPVQAAELKKLLHPSIQAVGVFVNEPPEIVADLLKQQIINVAQLHGDENEEYIRHLRTQTGRPIIKAFRMDTKQDAAAAEQSAADFILLDSGSGGTGSPFDWKLLSELKRPYFLAGGLNLDNISLALNVLRPYAVDVSSGIETNGKKDMSKMRTFVHAVRTHFSSSVPH